MNPFEIPIFITSKDRLSMVKACIDRLVQMGYQRLIIVDTGTTYEPLLEYYKTLPHAVHREPNPGGAPHLALWGCSILEKFQATNTPYVHTDCDVIPDDACPDNVLEYLFELLMKYRRYPKVGLSLRTDDLPDHFAGKDRVIAHEQQFYTRPLEPGVYDSYIDTTFALYAPSQLIFDYQAIRTGAPRMARHLPWYADSANPDPETIHYRAHCAPSIRHW